MIFLHLKASYIQFLQTSNITKSEKGKFGAPDSDSQPDEMPKFVSMGDRCY